MKCLVTGNSAVNVVSRLQSRLPSSARRDSGAVGACSGQAPAVRVSTLSRHNVHAHNTQPQLMAGAGRPGGAEAGNTQHRVALRVPQGREIIGLGHFLKQSFTGSIVFKPVKQSGELGPTWLALSSFLVSCVRFY